jgi:hypothetical protein
MTRKGTLSVPVGVIQSRCACKIVLSTLSAAATMVTTRLQKKNHIRMSSESPLLMFPVAPIVDMHGLLSAPQHNGIKGVVVGSTSEKLSIQLEPVLGPGPPFAPVQDSAQDMDSSQIHTMSGVALSVPKHRMQPCRSPHSIGTFHCGRECSDSSRVERPPRNVRAASVALVSARHVSKEFPGIVENVNKHRCIPACCLLERNACRIRWRCRA